MSCNNLHINGKTYYIKDNFDCNTLAVVYIIKCLKCNIFYVGQTGNSIRTRIQAHLGDILHNRDTAVANHFNGSLHDINDQFRFCPLEKALELKYRLMREAHFMSFFDTIYPKGLNIKFDHVRIKIIFIL